MTRGLLKVCFVLCCGLGLSGGGDTAERELDARLESPLPEKRRSAVKALAKIGNRASWRLVLGALADESEQVADQSQLVLGQLDDEEVLSELLGKRGLLAKEVLVRRRAAETLGRLKLAVDGSALIKGLGDRDVEVRRRVLWSIERLARRDLLAGELGKKVVPAVLRKWKGDRVAEIRAASLMALKALDPEVAEELASKGLVDRRVAVRGAALLVLADQKGAAEHLEESLGSDESSRVRSLLIETYERLGSRAAARALVACMVNDPRVRLRWSALQALRRISGMKYRMHAKPWEAWAERLPSSWRAARGKLAEIPTGASRIFGGMPLLSDRVAFLFDLSGSLWNKREDGTTRKEYADRQLKLALGTLQKDAKFNIIPYTKHPFPWSEELEPANSRNLERAYKDFENCRESGQGNFYEAALLALQDPEIDTIMVLTDGAPTGGEIWSLELMIPMLLSQTRFNRVRFDTILVDSPKPLRKYWEELAEGSGGQVIVVDADSR